MEAKIVRQPHGLGHTRNGIINGACREDGITPVVQVLDEEGRPIAPVPAIAPEDLRSMYEWMVRVRVFDTRTLSLQRQGRIHFFAPSFGEEATQIGTVSALDPEDWIFPAYREQGVALYRGYPLETLLCQMIGNAEDLLRGRQMPDHFGSPRYRFAVASSPVGTQIPHAVGAAWTARLRRESYVTAVYFGDGATSTGEFHAGMNFAAVQQAPAVFLCKNNGWAISLPAAKQCRAEALADKACGYGMPGVRVDGNDLLAVYQVTKEAVEWARSGSGPVFIEMLTQRMGGHSTSDDPARYRDPQLLEPWKKRNPLHRMRRYLESRHLWSEEEEQRAFTEADARYTEALRWAESVPPPSVPSMFEDVYAEMPQHLREQQDEARQ